VPNAIPHAGRSAQTSAARDKSTRLLKLIGEAEVAIFQRFQELPENADSLEESRAMMAACDELLKLKSEGLSWPRVPGKRREARTDGQIPG